MLTQIEELPVFSEPVRSVPLERVDPEAIRHRVSSRRRYARLKRVMDFVIVVAALPATVPVILICGLAVLILSGRPIFFVQERIGLDGERFNLFKFRSMRVHQPVTGHATMQNDARVTPIGSFLRRTHMDELPQLWNIVKGEMSLIGPRPEQPQLVREYQAALPHYDLRSLVKPGLSGWSQVFYGYAADLNDTRKKLEYDFYYLSNFGPGIDVLILLRTFKVYLRSDYVR